MSPTLFHKSDLLKAFLPLSQNSQICLEVLLIHPKTLRVEGRGFFNDPDFVLEACSPLVGRYNFALSPFGYAAESVPSRQAYNQFDRGLLDGTHQDQGMPHSLSVSFQFKPDLFRELDPAKGNHVLQVVYLIDGILGRIPLKTFSLDFGVNSMTARFIPACAGTYPDLTRSQYLDVTRRLIERIEKEMFPQEHKKFLPTSMALGKAWDPLPGMPLVTGGEDNASLPSATAGALQFASEPLFQQIFEDVILGPKAKASGVYAPANLQGLSQNWEAVTDDNMINPHVTAANPASVPRPKTEAKPEPEIRDTKFVDTLATYFHSLAQNPWIWPLPSQTFHRHYSGLGCGQVLMMQCAPFGAETALHFLMHSGEVFAREKGAQLLVFSKRHAMGELALYGLARHLKRHPLAVQNGGKPPDSQALAAQFAGLFPHPPLFIDCAPNENIEHLMRYLEHDYSVRAKKNGASLLPLAILIDGVDDFHMATPEETFRQMAQLKSRLRDLNAGLWLLDPLIDGRASVPTLPGLVDFLLRLDFDGSLSGEESNTESWEFSFALDPALRAHSAELSLIRVHFQAHGSHRRMQSSYVHWPKAGLFKELVTTPS
jgi:hypothetical protein